MTADARAAGGSDTPETDAEESERCADEAAAALEAHEGWVSVPREPTEAMMLAGMEVVPMVKQYADIGSKSVYKGSISSAIGHLECGEVYRAMIAAAPAGERK